MFLQCLESRVLMRILVALYIFSDNLFFIILSGGFIFYFAMNVITKALSTSIVRVLPALNVPARLVIAENRLNNIRNMSYEIVERGAPNSLDYKLYFSKLNLF